MYIYIYIYIYINANVYIFAGNKNSISCMTLILGGKVFVRKIFFLSPMLTGNKKLTAQTFWLKTLNKFLCTKLY